MVIRTEESKKKQSKKLKGRLSPMKGKFHKEKSKYEIGNFSRNKTYEEIYGIEKSKIEKEKRKNSHKGKKFTKDHKQNLSKSHLGQIPWNKGLKKGK